MCQVPTLLSCVDPAEAPGIRLLIVGGEACPQSVIDAWGKDKDRLFFNTYGPTEATVVATYSRCLPSPAAGQAPGGAAWAPVERVKRAPGSSSRAHPNTGTPTANPQPWLGS